MKSKRQQLTELLRPIVKAILKESNDGIDSDAVREVVLYAENDERLYRVLMDTYVPALKKFKKKGTFDRDKALKLLEYYWSNYVRPKYKREFGDVMLNPRERKEFANYFLTSLESDGVLDEQ